MNQHDQTELTERRIVSLRERQARAARLRAQVEADEAALDEKMRHLAYMRAQLTEAVADTQKLINELNQRTAQMNAHTRKNRAIFLN